MRDSVGQGSAPVRSSGQDGILSYVGTDMTVCIVQPSVGAVSETFIRAHTEHLPAAVTVIHGFIPHVNGRPIESQFWLRRLARGGWRRAEGRADWAGHS